jgi:hypothetical protein
MDYLCKLKWSDDNDDKGQPAQPVGKSAGQSQDGAIAAKSLLDEGLQKRRYSTEWPT